MSKNRNTKDRSAEIHCAAKELINTDEYNTASPAVAKALRVVAQKRLMELTGCTATTARSHVDRVLKKCD